MALFTFQSLFTDAGNLAMFSVSAAQAGSYPVLVTQTTLGTVTIRKIAADGSIRTIMGSPFTTASSTQNINFTAGNYEVVLSDGVTSKKGFASTGQPDGVTVKIG